MTSDLQQEMLLKLAIYVGTFVLKECLGKVALMSFDEDPTQIKRSHVNRRMVHGKVLIYFIFASVSHHEVYINDFSGSISSAYIICQQERHLLDKALISQSSVDGKHYAIKVKKLI
ncbi:hypothetical protein P8452_58131 [Trifolium repens]|nr:hypothetical protein P8452_58131 [Trifolium repens]